MRNLEFESQKCCHIKRESPTIVAGDQAFKSFVEQAQKRKNGKD